MFERLSTFAGSFDLDRAELVCAGEGIDDSRGLGTAGRARRQVDGRRANLRGRGRGTGCWKRCASSVVSGWPNVPSTTRRTRRTYRCTSTSPSGPAIGLGGPDEAHWAEELDASFDDMREAHACAVIDGDVDRAIRLVVALREYAWRRIRYELLAWADATVTMPCATEHPMYPVALGVIAYGRFVRGELDAAVEVGEAAVAAARQARHTHLRARRTGLGNALFFLDREVEACEWMDRMLEAATAARFAELCSRHAHYMRSVAETSLGNRDGGADLARAVGRRRRTSARSPTRSRSGRLRPRRVVRGDRSRAGAAPSRRQRAPRRGRREPVDPRVRAHRESLAAGEVGKAGRRRFAATTT